MIKQNSVASIHYSVSTTEGVEIDSSRSGEPLEYIQGLGFLVPGLEQALNGKPAGEQFSVTVEATEAYGARNDNLIQAVPKEMFAGMELAVGMSFRATTDEGEQSVIVIDVSDDEVIVDGNHPLAGVDLVFVVEVLAVRDATELELSDGRVHKPGCCDRC